MGIKLFLPDVRLSFPVLGEPEYYGGEKKKSTDKRRWSATALVPVDSPLHKKVNETIVAVAKEKWPEKYASILKNQITTDPKACCYQNGERKEYEGYQGHWALSAHRYEDAGRPLVYDRKKHPIYHMKKGDGHDVNDIVAGQEGIIYGGCYVNVEVEIWAQQNTNGKGIRATLMGVQFFRKGDSFGGGSRPDEGAFGAIEDGADAGDMDEGQMAEEEDTGLG
jgi:hypothetical protein